MNVIFGLVTVTDCSIRVSQSAAAKASLLPQNASIIPDSCYARNYTGIIASSLLLTARTQTDSGREGLGAFYPLIPVQHFCFTNFDYQCGKYKEGMGVAIQTMLILTKHIPHLVLLLNLNYMFIFTVLAL